MTLRNTLIEGCDIITLDGQGTILRNSRLALSGAQIAGVGELPEDFRADDRIEAEGKVLMPALFNAHCHSPMTFERGWAEDLPLDRWFNERIWVAESALTEEDVLWGARLAACEMLRAGTVGFNDHYFYMDRVAEVAAASGMKASLAWCVFGIGKDKEVGAELEDTLRFIDRWQNAADGRIRTVLGPHSPYICPPEFLQEVSALALEKGLALHIHAAESQSQVAQSLEQHGKTPIAHLEQCGLLEVPITVAHCLYLTPGELNILARPGITVARCPITYMKLAMGTGDAEELLRLGVNLALGTDGPGSNNDMNMLAVVRIFSLLQKHVRSDAEAMAGALPLRLACQGGAKACGFPDSGVIATGAPADLILLDFSRPHLRPRHDLVANIIHCANSGDVTDVMCNGDWLMREGALTTLDEEEILAEAERRALAMVGKQMKMVRSYDA